MCNWSTQVHLSQPVNVGSLWSLVEWNSKESVSAGTIKSLLLFWSPLQPYSGPGAGLQYIGGTEKYTPDYQPITDFLYIRVICIY